MAFRQRAFYSLLNGYKPFSISRASTIQLHPCSYRLTFASTNTTSTLDISPNGPNTPNTPSATNPPSSLDSLAKTAVMPKFEICTKEPQEALQIGTKLVGQSGMQYKIDRMLQHRTDPILTCVYLAFGQDKNKYVLKNIFHTEFEYQLNMQIPLRDCPNLRVVTDTIPEHLLFVYNYCTDDLLKLAGKENLSDATKKRILRDALVGLADLHERNILHGDIKPNNIFVEYDEKTDSAIEVKRVQVGDLEMGSIMPPGLSLSGARLGNPMWRSPEAHAAARINLSSDIFSFGLVCIYTMIQRVTFGIDIEGLSEADEEKLIVKRLLSHFGDGLGLIGLLEHLDDSVASWRGLVLAVVPEFTASDPRKPFSLWEDIDECFRDVITKMTSLDPKRRITAREALEHPWFQNV